MAILNIVKEGDPILRQTAKPVDKVTKRIKILVKDMLKTMYESNGAGLAAPQVAVSERIVVIDVGEGPLVLLNPKILETSGKERDSEGCLSIPGRFEYITRAAKVKVAAMDLKGHSFIIEGEGFLARALQHEIEHLDGILYIDHLNDENN